MTAVIMDKVPTIWRVAGTPSDLSGPERFMSLVRSHEAVMLRVARRLCGHDACLAEDCVQDAIVLAYRAVADEKFSDFENFRPWILRILTNRFYRLSEKARKTVTHENFDLLVDRVAPASASGDVEAFVESEALREEVESALQALPEDQRACVVLVAIEGLEYAEAARILDVPVGTVRSRMNRARLKMADWITRGRMTGEQRA